MNKSMESLFCLPAPLAASHKGQNGVVLIIGGSKTYHGAPILAALAARHFCDLVYFSSTDENNKIIKRMKIATPNVICLPPSLRKKYLAKADCILIGNGMDVNSKTKRLVGAVLKMKKKCVLDASALRVLSPSLLHEKAILTPHSLEFRAAFGAPPSEKSAAKMSEKCRCTILLKGREDILASQGKIIHITGGNAGMTKGGTGDVLAGLLCALYSQNDSPASAAYTAAYLNKRAGERLFERLGYYFSSEELAEELPFAANALYKGFKKPF
ncbi:MAG: NAD(P)H-hydrate dehydratase [Candidatus Micrarchaeota archaeon]|nr:NAD(P)H-hydrate dehydratase [Candidatus Micrarchaeota archaeon]